MNNEDIRASLEEMLKAYKLEEGALKESLEKIDAALYDHGACKHSFKLEIYHDREKNHTTFQLTVVDLDFGDVPACVETMGRENVVPSSYLLFTQEYSL